MAGRFRLSSPGEGEVARREGLHSAFEPKALSMDNFALKAQMSLDRLAHGERFLKRVGLERFDA
jgi:hypothetical protein